MSEQMFPVIASLASAHWAYEYQFKSVRHDVKKAAGFFDLTAVVGMVDESHGLVDDVHLGSPSSVG